jgi:hypothetical protein
VKSGTDTGVEFGCDASVQVSASRPLEERPADAGCHEFARIPHNYRKRRTDFILDYS